MPPELQFDQTPQVLAPLLSFVLVLFAGRTLYSREQATRKVELKAEKGIDHVGDTIIEYNSNGTVVPHSKVDRMTKCCDAANGLD